MNTRCERQGQIEIGVVEHQGNEFVALGGSVVGNSITGYTKQIDNQLVLTTWCGHVMLDCRSEIVESYRSGTMAILFRLTKKRCIVGYALGDDGMLFRGELLCNVTQIEAENQARSLADHFAELDAEDEMEFKEE